MAGLIERIGNSANTALVAGETSSSQSGATALASANALGKQDFLQLLIAQLRNQDPLKPMEDKDFIAQLAQFSALEATQSLSTKIDSLAKTSQLEQAAGLVGRRVQATLADGSTVEGVVSQMKIVDGVPKLLVNDQTVGVDSVTAVLS